MSDLFGGGDQKTTTEVKLPPWLAEGAKATINRATGIANQPYTPYQGPRVAALSGNQQAGINLAAANQGNYQGALTQAGQMAGASAQPLGMSYAPGTITPQQVSTGTWNDAARDQYMSPYIKGALDPVKRDLVEASDRERNRRNAMAVSRGAFGGSRQAIEDMKSEDYLLENIGDVYAKGYDRAYNNAQGAFAQDQGRSLQAQGMNQGADLSAQGQNEANRMSGFRLNADIAQSDRDAQARGANTMMALGETQQDLGTKDAQNLLATGALQRGVTQQNYDTAYQNFIEQRDWDMRGLDAMLRSINGVPYPQSSTTSGNTGQSPLSQIAGLGLAAYGLWG